MNALEALYLQDPFWIWLGVTALFVSLCFAMGSNVFLLPAACAVLVVLAELAGLRLGAQAEVAGFVVLSVLAVTGAFVLQPRARAAFAGAAARRAAEPAEPSSLVGRIARTAGEFVNGVGRVWIDGTIWAAEIEGAEESLAPGVSVRVVRVVGGVKLQVRPIEANGG